jgi:glycosyltransferase involved in cell wall biosynthesis
MVSAVSSAHDSEGPQSWESSSPQEVPVVQDCDCGTQFHVVSFEGPDSYARAGGIASRVAGLTEALANYGFETHLWFVGDPALPGHEAKGQLHLHRWCQWISHYHPGGVYDGEEGKVLDFVASLPPFLTEVLVPHVRAGGRAVVLAEEWQTANAVLHLDWLLQREGIRNRIAVLWNANNTFGFDRINWEALAQAATVTTVSRYMKHLMHGRGVDPIVVPNGLSADAFFPAPRGAVTELGRRVRDRIMVTKIARWDPDKGWVATIGIVRELKRQGLRPLLVARGGVEPHGADVLAAAASAGLRVVERDQTRPDAAGTLEALDDLDRADMVSLRSPLGAEGRRVLLRGAATVLANSSHEPFGLVGLETMAAGGLACTGYSGEDYAVPGRNAVVLQTGDPQEFVGVIRRLLANPDEERAIRRAGRSTARQYAWPEILKRCLLPRLQLLSVH